MRVTKPAVSAAKPKSVTPKAAPKATPTPTPTAPARPSRLGAMLGLNPAVVAALTRPPPRPPTCELPPTPGPTDHATGPNGKNDDGGVVGLPGGDSFA